MSGTMYVVHFTCPVDASTALNEPRNVQQTYPGMKAALFSSAEAAPTYTVPLATMGDWVMIEDGCALITVLHNSVPFFASIASSRAGLGATVGLLAGAMAKLACGVGMIALFTLNVVQRSTL